MSKDYTLDRIRNLRGSIQFNYSENEEDYYAVRVVFRGKALDTNVSGNCYAETKTGLKMGAKHTDKEIYTVLGGINQSLATKLKDMYVDWINEDISE